MNGDFWQGQPIPWFAVYGFLTALTLFLAWRSGHHVLQKLALLLLLAWATSNCVIGLLGFSGGPYVIPAADATIAVMAAGLGLQNRSPAALIVVGLFLTEMAVHIVGFATMREGTYAYYLALNMIFLLQLGVVGGAAVKESIRGLVIGHERVFHRGSSA